MIARQIKIEGEIAYVPLSRGYVAIIDAADVPLVDGVNWTAAVHNRLVYAHRNATLPDGKRRYVAMHRVILGDSELHVDHRDGDGLNNRRSNLRWATRFENMSNRVKQVNNSTGFPGVTFHKRDKKFMARVTANGKTHSAGYFDCPKEAYAARCDLAKRLHGEFARFDAQSKQER